MVKRSNTYVVRALEREERKNEIQAIAEEIMPTTFEIWWKIAIFQFKSSMNLTQDKKKTIPNHITATYWKPRYRENIKVSQEDKQTNKQNKTKQNKIIAKEKKRMSSNFLT